MSKASTGVSQVKSLSHNVHGHAEALQPTAICFGKMDKVELNSSEQACLREQMRRLRLLCPLLRLHILLLLAQQHSPTDIADWLLCSRSSVYEVAAYWRQGGRPFTAEQTEEAEPSFGLLTPSLRRSLLA